MYLKTQKTSLCFPPRDVTSLFQGKFVCTTQIYIQLVLSGMPRVWSYFCLSQSCCHLALLTWFSGVYSRNIKSQGTPSLNLWRKMKTVIQRLYFSHVFLSWFYFSFWGTWKKWMSHKFNFFLMFLSQTSQCGVFFLILCLLWNWEVEKYKYEICPYPKSLMTPKK